MSVHLSFSLFGTILSKALNLHLSFLGLFELFYLNSKDIRSLKYFVLVSKDAHFI